MLVERGESQGIYIQTSHHDQTPSFCIPSFVSFMFDATQSDTAATSAQEPYFIEIHLAW